MQRLFDPVNESLKKFVEQRDDLALVVRVTHIESAYVLKMIESLDEAVLPDIFWTFVQNFEAPAAYVDAVLEAFRAKFDGTRALMKNEGMRPWPDPPAALFDRARAPVARMRELMVFARSLLPTLEGMNLVWVLFPLEVKAPLEWARFVAELLRHEVPFAWCHHMRLLLRDASEAPALSQHLRGAKRVQWLAPDLSPRAMEKAIEEDAADESMPLPQRLQALLQLGMLDFSHRRYPAAMEKFTLLMRYSAATRDHTMLSLVLNQIGEIYDRTGEAQKARHYFESAITPAAEGNVYPVLLNVTLNLGNWHLAQKSWADAESYYRSGADLARAMRNPYLVVRCLENLGVCRHAQRDLGGAWEQWHAAATLARGVEEHTLLKEVLDRLRAMFREANMRKEYTQVEQELAKIEALLPKVT
ncbi:hypothetical protein [Sorangium sp. So ce1335]|uniref:tetratricopeptide repeat protein n=1 Tax=Sorangium sp. So ce1335 TaxID=3133335 RepID=UPI003F5DED69